MYSQCINDTNTGKTLDILLVLLTLKSQIQKFEYKVMLKGRLSDLISGLPPHQNDKALENRTLHLSLECEDGQ